MLLAALPIFVMSVCCEIRKMRTDQDNILGRNQTQQLSGNTQIKMHTPLHYPKKKHSFNVLAPS